jgi:hypothetical protein
MLFESPQILFLVFVLGIVLSLYEMRQALIPARCAECPHCRAVLEEAHRRETELAERYARSERLTRRDDEDRAP